jgi:hypothetical protein
MKKKIAGIVAALAASVSLMAFAGPASAVPACDFSQPELQYACNLFEFYSNRSFDTSEATYWAGVGQQYGHTFESLVLIHSVEVDSELVNEVYNAVLDRDGDPAGLQYWTNQVASGNVLWEDVIGLFGDTTEGKAVLSNDQFTTLLYHAFLDRDPSADELVYWSGIADNVSRLAVAHGISHSDEAANRIIPFVFESLLGREATPGDVAYWGPIYQSIGYLDIFAIIGGSDEAFANLSQVPTVVKAGALQSTVRAA